MVLSTAKRLGVLALLCVLFTEAPVASTVTPTPIQSYSGPMRQIEIQEAYRATPRPDRSPGPTPTAEPALVPDPISIPFPSPVDRQQPQPKAKAEPKPTPRPKPKAQPLPRSRTSGVASWYCLQGRSRCTSGYPGGLYAAVRRDLLWLRGKTINVCQSGTRRCVKVVVIDCNCGPHANVIDLYSDAFRRLAPLSRGRLDVTLRW